jgi:hypothetical protein
MTEIPPFRKAVVAFLVTDDCASLDAYTTADWVDQFRWLDRSGLALPLAVRILESRHASRFPAPVVRALTIRLCDNESRMKSILELFCDIQAALARERIKFCCLKGFSLIPDVYGSIRERHQLDIDLLIDPRDAARAVLAVGPLGYTLTKNGASGEMHLTRAWKRHLTADSWLYQIPEGPPLELHTRLWEPETELVDFPIPLGSMNRIEVNFVAGVAVPRLAPAWQFVSLVLHIFRHLLDSWVRLLSLYEVSVYLRCNQQDDDLWAEVSTILATDTRLSSACTLVLQLVKREFRAKFPEGLDELCRLSLTADSSTWCENFGESWLYADPPGTKLSLLVQRQFSASRNAWRAYLRRRLFPRRLPPKLSDDASTKVKRSMRYRAAEAGYQARRVGYHIASDWQYLWAAARWKRLVRSNTVMPHLSRESTDSACDAHASNPWQAE